MLKVCDSGLHEGGDVAYEDRDNDRGCPACEVIATLKNQAAGRSQRTESKLNVLLLGHSNQLSALQDRVIYLDGELIRLAEQKGQDDGT